MSYVKTGWVNGPNTATPITADRLNNLETQHDAALAQVAADIPNGSSPIGAVLSTTIATGVDTAVPPAVAAALADPDTTTIVTDAAAAAVASATADLSLIESEFGEATGWKYALHDDSTREVFFGERTDGTFYPPDLNPGDADQIVSAVSADQGWRFAFLAEGDEVLFGQRNDGTFYPDIAKGVIPGVVIHGDSTTNGWTQRAAELATSLDTTVAIRGDSGRDSIWAAARQGGEPLHLTVTGNQLPASGSVACTIGYTPKIGTSQAAMPLSTLAGVLAGVPVTLTVTAEGTGTVARIENGRATPVPPGSRFITGLNDRERWPVFWLGRNNFKLANDSDQLIRDIESMLAWTRHPDRAVLLSILPDASETSGTAGRTTLDTVNTAIQARFPAIWEDTASRLRSVSLLAAVGITATATDTTNIADGVTPLSLRNGTDTIHLGGVGYDAMNILLHEIYASRGLI